MKALLLVLALAAVVFGKGDVPGGQYDGMYTIIDDEVGDEIIQYLQGPFPWYIDGNDEQKTKELKMRQQMIGGDIDPDFCGGCFDWYCYDDPCPSKRCYDCPYRYKFDCDHKDKDKDKKLVCEIQCEFKKDRKDDRDRRW